jgi:hypothetical protein
MELLMLGDWARQWRRGAAAIRVKMESKPEILSFMFWRRLVVMG